MSILLLGFLDFSDLVPSDRQNSGPPKMSLSFPLPTPAKLSLLGKKDFQL